MREVQRIRPEDDDLPANIEAEQVLLGALMIHNDCVDMIADRLTAESFAEPLHGRIFQLIVDRVTAGALASPITLKGALEHDEGLGVLGGPAYLARMAGASCPPAAVRDYAEVVADMEARRSLIEATREAAEALRRHEAAPVAVAAQLESQTGKVLAKVSRRQLVRSHLSTMVEAVQWVTDAVTGETNVGVSTGIPDLDRALGKPRAGQLLLLGGRPGSGKTSIAQNIAYNVARDGGGVFFASLEMTQADIGVRFLARGLADRGRQIPYSRMLSGGVNEDEHRAIVEEAKRQEALPLTIAERNVRALPMLRAAVRRARQVMADTPHPLRLVVVDYLQLLQPEKAGGTYDRVSAASDACKDLAMELGVPVLALAQLSRSVESRDPPVPQMADLRDSGRLEEDADAIIFAYREAYYLQRNIAACDDDEERMSMRARLEQVRHHLALIVAKQRQGSGGTVQVRMDMALCHMTADYAHTDNHLI